MRRANNGLLQTKCRQRAKGRRTRVGKVRFPVYRQLEFLESRLLLTVYVDAAAINGTTHDGTSWSNAFTDLQAGISAATSQNAILEVAQGTYKPTAGTDRHATFQWSFINMFGRYGGLNSVTPDIEDVVKFPTILSGDIGVAGGSSDNSYHVVTAGGGDFRDFTVSDGNANGPSNPDYYGGGMYIANASPEITNCTFIHNVCAANGGGGIYDVNASPEIINCKFLGNTAGAGGGLYNYQSSPVVWAAVCLWGTRPTAEAASTTIAARNALRQLHHHGQHGQHWRRDDQFFSHRLHRELHCLGKQRADRF